MRSDTGRGYCRSHPFRLASRATSGRDVDAIIQLSLISAYDAPNPEPIFTYCNAVSRSAERMIDTTFPSTLQCFSTCANDWSVRSGVWQPMALPMADADVSGLLCRAWPDAPPLHAARSRQAAAANTSLMDGKSTPRVG